MKSYTLILEYCIPQKILHSLIYHHHVIIKLLHNSKFLTSTRPCEHNAFLFKSNFPQSCVDSLCTRTLSPTLKHNIMQRYAGKPIILITTTKTHSRTQHKNSINVEVQLNCIIKGFARSHERIGLASATKDALYNAIHSQT